MAKFGILSPTYFLCLMSIAMQICIATSYNVLDFGAVPNGKTDSTSAFAGAWTAACKSNKESTVVVPRGTLFVNSVSFNGPCKNGIRFRITGSIVAPRDYRFLSDHQAWLKFYRVSRLSIVGGKIDAKGSSYWSCKTGGRGICPYNARSIALQSCDRVHISGLTSLNSQGVHIHINGCNDVSLQNLKLIAPAESPNTDGIHIGNSRLFRVSNSTIATGDDCISIRPGSMDMRIERIQCGPGHGISIGSMGGNPRENGVENIVVTNSVFTNTDNGVRIKTWAKPSNIHARDIVFENLQMKNVANPIIIDQEYCPAKNCPKVSSGVKVSNVTFNNIKGTSRSQEAITLLCSSTKPCEGVKLRDINLRYISQFEKVHRPAISRCLNAKVTRVGLVFPKC